MQAFKSFENFIPFKQTNEQKIPNKTNKQNF